MRLSKTTTWALAIACSVMLGAAPAFAAGEGAGSTAGGSGSTGAGGSTGMGGTSGSGGMGSAGASSTANGNNAGAETRPYQSGQPGVGQSANGSARPTTNRNTQ